MKMVITFFLLLYTCTVSTAEISYHGHSISKQELEIRAQGDCPVPVGPDHGGIHYCETDVGATACYCCCTDYELVGDGERTCQSDGTWSGDEPVCRPYAPLECPALTVPENGNVELSDGTNIGSIATYSCNDGYALSGSDTRICEEGGSWSGNAPTCEVIQCDALSDPDNGAVSVTGTGIGDTATYTCDDGYELIGSSTRTCQSNGEWSDAPPICEYIGCELPPDIEHGSYTLSDGTEVGSVATYSCDIGFKLTRQSLTCGANGRWIGTVPRCLDINECKDNKGGCQHRCVNTVGSYHCECRRKFFLLPDGKSCERIDVEFSERSPMVGDGRIDAELINNDDRVTRLECFINCSYPSCPTFPVKDCTDLRYSQEGLVTGRRYCLTFVAYIGPLSDGSIATYREPGKCFTPGSNNEPYYCAVNRVGEPEYIGENDVSLAFAPSGPIDAFRCSTNGGANFNPCTSRWQSSNSSPGPGEVIVCPVSEICYDAPSNGFRRSACRCITFQYDTTKGEFGEKYKTNYYLCFNI